MTKWSDMPYTQQLRWRIRLQWAGIVLLLALMVIVGETGGGDSRFITQLADTTSTLLFFGGIAFLGVRIYLNKKTLADRLRLREKALTEQDERNRSLHLRSGGFVMDAMLLVLYTTTMLTGMYSMAAFHTAFGLFLAAIALKAGAYWLCSRNG